MSNSLDLLARLSRNNIEALQGQLHALNSQIYRLDRELESIDASVEEAYDTSIKSIEDAETLALYKKTMMGRRERNREEYAKLERERQDLESKIMEEFRTMKRYEIVSRRRGDEERRRIERHAEVQRDELGVARFQRKRRAAV